MAYGSESVLMLLQPSGDLALIDTVSGDLLESFNLDGYSGPEYLTMGPEGQIFANLQLFGGQNRLQLLSLSPFEPLYELDRYPLPAAPLIAPVGDLLAMPRRGEVELWELHSNTLTGKLESSMSEVGVLAFTPDGSRLIAASGEIWDLRSREVAATFESSDPSMSVITNGSVILGQDGTIWSLTDGARLGRLDTQPALEFAFTPDGSQIIWQRTGGIVEVWGIEGG
jgi:WD40 repeat protein